METKAEPEVEFARRVRSLILRGRVMQMQDELRAEAERRKMSPWTLAREVADIAREQGWI